MAVNVCVLRKVAATGWDQGSEDVARSRLERLSSANAPEESSP